MSIYRVANVSDEPWITLAQWSIRRATANESVEGNNYFVGRNLSTDEGRVSTPIIEFDPMTRTGVTRSGRRYRLVGRAGRNGDADYVWDRIASVWAIESWLDVTAELVPDWRNDNPLSEYEPPE